MKPTRPIAYQSNQAGRYFFPDGLKALADARAAGCAVVFVTNGGGGLGEEEYLLGFKKKILSASGEADPATKALLAKELDGIGVESMILSYTPMGEDLSFKKKRVLLVGDPKEKVKAAAASYGWKNAVHVSEYVKKHSTVRTTHPFITSGCPNHLKNSFF